MPVAAVGGNPHKRRLVNRATAPYTQTMDREPGDFARDVPGAPNKGEDATDRLLADLPPAPGIRHIDDDGPDDIAAALADVAAGRCYDHATVSRWLMTWGTPDRKPFREWFAAQDG